MFKLQLRHIAVVISLIIILGLLSGCISDRQSRLLLVPGTTNKVGASQAIAVNMPIGPETGDANEKLTYSVSMKSNLSGLYSYGFDWGDGNITWASSPIASYSWPNSGIYILRVQAKCDQETSIWSPGKVIMIGSGKISRSPLNRPDEAVQYVTPHSNQIKTALKVISEMEWKNTYNDLDAIREWVATNIRYKTDRDNFGSNDYWQFPMETLERGSGDCEDIAILTCSLLRSYGVPANQLYVVIGTPKGMNEYHAYIIERYSKGIWNMIEPQLDPVTSAVSFTFLDWALTSDYSSDLYCFNDQYYFRGLPGVSTGVYDLNLWHSFWPLFPSASNKLERKLKAEDKVEGTIQWLGNESIVFDWSLFVYDPTGNIVLNWSGVDTKRNLEFKANVSGMYRIEIVKRDYAPRNLRVILNPTGWIKAKN
jgi:predicted transglutaminase-like cysteine proteinase